MKLTLARARELKVGDILHQTEPWATNADGTPRRWKVNGRVRRWKRDPDRIRIPIKHGLYSHDSITEEHFVDGVCSILEIP